MKEVAVNVVTLFFIVAMLALLIMASGCAPAPRINPPVFRYDNEVVTILSADAHARDIGGRTFTLSHTGSMEPMLTGDDRIVVVRVPFSELKDGEIIVYRAQWAVNGIPICHRIVGRDKLGLIMAGDATRHNESGWRVTDANYIGRVIAVYRTNKNASN